MEIRRINVDERPALSFPLQAYAFEASPASAERMARYRDHLPHPEDSITLVAEAGGTALATVSAIPMRQNVRGVVHPMAGIAGVASHPLARRQGHVRALLTRLLGEMRDEGYACSALYPFRPSFYGRFGYAVLAQSRAVTFAPADLGWLLRAELPGEVTWQRIKDGYRTYRDFTLRLLGQRHGFSALPDSRARALGDEDGRWLVTADVAGETVAAATYRIDGYAGDLVADHLLTTSPLSRALLLQFFARHVDQVARIRATVAADETPELWGTDLAIRVEAKVAFPDSPAPMARVLSVEALAGTPVGPGRVAVELVDDPFIGGRYVFDGHDGLLDVARGASVPPAAAAATLTSAGLAALVYGVLDPADVAIRGFGAVPDDAAAELRTIFPRASPYIFAAF